MWIYVFTYLDPRLKQLGEEKLGEWRQWFDSRLDDAIEAADYQGANIIECRFSNRIFYLHKIVLLSF